MLVLKSKELPVEGIGQTKVTIHKVHGTHMAKILLFYHHQIKVGGKVGQSLKLLAFPGSSVVKNLPANAGDLGSIPGSGERNGNPFPYSRQGL